MKYLYLTSNGLYLKMSGHVLIAMQKGKTLGKYNTEKLTDIYISGGSSISSGVIEFAVKNNIQITFLNYHGDYLARISGENRKNINLRIAQYRFFDNESAKLKFVKKIVFAKLSNYRTFILRLNRKISNSVLSNAAAQLRNCIRKSENSDNIETIRGYEGKGSAIYFNIFNYFMNENFIFIKRTRRPPLDPVNAMLSFGYTMLYTIFSSLIYLRGLDPMLGSLHTPDYGRNSLALDLMEEFRPIIVDSLVITLINKNSISKKDFEYNPELNLPCAFTKNGKKTFINFFEEKLDCRLKYLKHNTLLPFRKVIEYQVNNFANFIEDTENNIYEPVIIR